jgi:PTH1 family peptidyl-tRNA hydrolase
LSSGIQLIVGLGNPGADYEATRHNAGAWFVLDLAQNNDAALRSETRFHGLHGTARIHGHDVHLLIPTTYMNLSGQSVGALASYYKIPAEAILVAHDEIDLPVGDIRLKFDGGHGGHNGLRDIFRHLNTNKFHRLRIGVGHPGNSKEVVDYVLKPPKKSEREQIDTALHEALRVLPQLLDGQFQQATQELHTREK